MAIYLLEEALDPYISPVEVDPLAETESQDDIKFRHLCLSSDVIFRNIISLHNAEVLSNSHTVWNV